MSEPVSDEWIVSFSGEALRQWELLASEGHCIHCKGRMREMRPDENDWLTSIGADWNPHKVYGRCRDCGMFGQRRNGFVSGCFERVDAPALDGA